MMDDRYSYEEFEEQIDNIRRVFSGAVQSLAEACQSLYDALEDIQQEQNYIKEPKKKKGKVKKNWERNKFWE